jgi:hypothetical protein
VQVLALIRLSVPDRPGMLGDVASNIGAAGGDIAQVQVLESGSGRALDDVYVNVRDAEHLTRVQNRLSAVAGTQIVGVKIGPPPTTGHSELELIGRMLAAPGRAVQTLVDGVPDSTGSDWAAAVRYGADETVEEVVATSPTCPGPDQVPTDIPLRLTVVGEPYVGLALVPLTGTRLGLVVVRESGPPFHPAELWRLEQVGTVAGRIAGQATMQASAASSELEVTA